MLFYLSASLVCNVYSLHRVRTYVLGRLKNVRLQKSRATDDNGSVFLRSDSFCITADHIYHT